MFARELIKNAKIIHIHNMVPYTVLEIIADLANDKIFFFQTHSPMHEPPVFDDHSASMGVEFAEKFVIGHFHPRHYQQYTIVPNCLYRPPMLKFTQPSGAHDKIRIIYSPSSKSRNRWSMKSDAKFNKTLAVVNDMPTCETITLQSVSPKDVLFRRALADISIDEVVTGGYHLVSYEGLAAGNIVFNNADLFSIATFASAFETSRMPPFHIGDSDYFLEKLIYYTKNRDAMQKAKRQAFDYFWEVMHPERVIKIFERHYARYLNA